MVGVSIAARGWTPACLLAATVVLSACAQGGRPLAMPADDRSEHTASVGRQPAPGGSGWSGEAGASGHPTMTANAIRAAAADFPACLAGLGREAERRGISAAAFAAHTAGLTPDLRIMDLLDRQPEFSKPFWDYLDKAVSDTRIRRGRELLAVHRPSFDAVERSYGVDRHVIAAIWGLESNFGSAAGDRPVLRSTATLACIGRRQDYFRDEFLAALEILQRGHIRPEAFNGSWAGAFGATQFMPTAFKRSAVDFNGDGRRDVIGSIPDILASTANKLKTNGWQPDRAWGYEVVVPGGFDFLLADRSRWLTIGEWQRHGLRRAGGKAFPRSTDRAYLLVPAGSGGPAFLMLENFRAIMKYNPSEAYALAIGHLADRMRGGEAFVQAWPRHERVLSRSERYELQQHLARMGFDVGTPDGRLGGKTRAAIRAFQARAGQVPDGFASAALLDNLRGS
jgi:lytic murein transglycosylase